VRGNKILALATLFIVGFAFSGFNVPKAYAVNTVSMDPGVIGPLAPGAKFSVNIQVDYVIGLRAFEFTLSWDQSKLKLVSQNPAVEGAFLSTGGTTFFVYSEGIAGESVTVANLITTYNWVTGGGVLATITLEAIGGGYSEMSLTGRLLDKDFAEMSGITWLGGFYWSNYPFAGFTWHVPTAEELPPQDFVNVTGNTFVPVIDPDGDLGYDTGPSYWTWAPVLQLTEDTGEPEQVNIVEGGTMFYGDEIIFDASASYDLDEELPDSAFHWVIRAGGVDTFTYRGTTYDTRYESGVELPYGRVFSYTFPGDLPSVYGLYSRLLGFHDLTLTVTDSDGNKAIYYTWIRIYRLVPARTVNVQVSNPKHSLSKDGYTMTLGGKVQNRGGCSDFPWDSLTVYLELARMIHANIWIRMQFEILDSAMNPVDTVYSDAIWLQKTETPVNPIPVTWNIPSDITPGTYYVRATGWFCGSGVTYGLKARGSATTTIKILP